MNIKKLFLFILIIILAISMSGCNKQDVAEQNTAADNKTLVLAAYRHLAPGNKDGLYCSKILGVWEPLITHNDDGTPKGALAESWEMYQGGKEWIFHLRQGVRFHNGTEFNADSVIKNFDRMKLGYKRSSFYGLNIDSYYPALVSYEKLDKYTVRLLFSEPNVNQLYKMMDFGSPIYAPECFAEDGNFKAIAIGTGPYKILENQLNKQIVLGRNDDYYGEKAHIEKIIVKVIPSPEVRYTALRAGEILGVIDINAIPPVLAAEIKQDDRFAVSVNKSTMMRYLAVNGSKWPFNDVRMRQAVSLAIDRDDLVQALYLGYASPTTNVVNYTSPYYKEIPVEYNLEKAKALAKEVLGNKRQPIIYCINGSEPLQKGEAELIAYWLKDIGLDVKIKSLEYATMSKMMRKGEYDLARIQRGLPNGDPYTIIYSFMMPDGAINKSNRMGYQNDEAEKLLAKVKHIVDEKERRAIFDRLQEIAVLEQPIIPLFNDRSIVAYSKKLKNYDALIYGVNLAEVEWVE